nr:spore coat protein CotS [Campylobacter coli]
MLDYNSWQDLSSNALIAREKIERFFMRSSLEKVIKNYSENFSNKKDNDFAQGLIKYLYENDIIGENDKIFLEKNFQYIRVINEKEKRLINVYFCEKPIIDFFQNAEYEKELQYYGINEKDFISLQRSKK